MHAGVRFGRRPVPRTEEFPVYERPVILTTRTGQKIAGIAREESLFGVDWLVLNAYDLDAARVTGNSESFDVYFNPDDVSSFAEVDGKVIKPFSENNPYRPASQRGLFEHGRPMPEKAHAAESPTPEGMKSFLEDILRKNGMGHIGVGDVQVIQVPNPGGERICNCPNCTAKRAAAQPSETAKSNAEFADHVSKAPHDGCDCPACARARFEKAEADGREFDRLTAPGGNPMPF